jgi:GNAT superfamily N-acetyltransferase
MSLQIASLQEKHLEEAAALVTARYKALRGQMPLLPSRYEQAGAILPRLRDLAARAPGVVALRGGRLSGFLTAMTIPDFLGRQSAYSPEWANGAEPGASRRVYEEMYAHLAARWVADGSLTHLVTMLAHDREAIEGWHWLGFGLAAVDGVRALEAVDGAAADVAVRRASAEDIEDATALDEALSRHMAAAPIFWLHEPQVCEAWLQEPANALWLAYDGGEAAGSIGIGPANPEACAIVQDEKTASIVSAFTRESARGRGIATALLNRALEWARAEGYQRCAVDFEPMNSPAVRFWTRSFAPVCYSLMRCICGQ